ILCVVLTGRPPYAEEGAEAAQQLAARAGLDDAFARLDGCGAEPELVALCKQCLSLVRSHRPADAGGVARAVAALRAAAEERARQAELNRAAAEARAAGEANTRRVAEEKAAEERKRRRVQLALAVSVGLLL